MSTAVPSHMISRDRLEVNNKFEFEMIFSLANKSCAGSNCLRFQMNLNLLHQFCLMCHLQLQYREFINIYVRYCHDLQYT